MRSRNARVTSVDENCLRAIPSANDRAESAHTSSMSVKDRGWHSFGCDVGVQFTGERKWPGDLLLQSSAFRAHEASTRLADGRAVPRDDLAAQHRQLDRAAQAPPLPGCLP